MELSSRKPLDAAARHDLLEIRETRQLPVDKCHELIGDPAYADAILDRVVHNAHRINLTGNSLRRSRAIKPCHLRTIDGSKLWNRE
jgi:hypothetical protein